MNATLLLHIETATPVCSVALSDGNQLLDFVEIDEPNVHASKLTLLIEMLAGRNNIALSDLSAVAISMGPGSYTGLRIGVSTAKGLCYALDLPLVAVHTLDAMAKGFLSSEKPEINDAGHLLCPMIDARRMEVYSAVYDKNLRKIADIAANIIDGQSFDALINERTIVLFGSGADKFEALFSANEKVIVRTGFKNSARYMVELAFERYSSNQFEDVAYFEPFYLKDFVATTPKKLA